MGAVKEGNDCKSFVYLFSTIYTFGVEMQDKEQKALTDNEVCESINFLFLRSTIKPYLVRKSAPMIARLTSAKVKGKIKFLRKPRSSFNNF